MSEPFLGEIRIFAGNFAPRGWALCDGGLLAINQYDALYSLIGTTYGGDGISSFGLPDLRGRLPVHQGSEVQIGQAGGTEAETITVGQIPPHSHNVLAARDAGATSPANAMLGTSGANLYNEGTTPVFMGPGSITEGGAYQPHDNLQPFLCLNYILALEGIYPSQS